MSLYEDIQKVGSTQQFPNARFRSEFIRSNMQNPGAFYKQFGADLTNPMGGTQSFNQPLEQLQTLPGTSSQPSNYTNTSTGGSGYSFTDKNPGTVGTGGLLSNNPYYGQLAGMALGTAGVPAPNVLGQAIAGTPQSMESALKGTMSGMGSSALAKVLGLPAGVVGMGVNALMSRQMPSMEDVVKTFAFSNPVTAPYMAALSAGKAAYSGINQMMADNYRNQAEFGLNNTGRTSFGPPTIGSKFGFSPDNEMRGEEGTGLVANPNYGMGFKQAGLYGNITKDDLGFLGSGVTPGMRGDIQASLAASALNDLYSKYSMGTPETYGVGGNTYGPETITSDMYGVNPDVMGPPQQPTYGGGYSGIGSNNDSDGSAGSTNPSGGGISGYGGGTY
jgi:hypothetical protein